MVLYVVERKLHNSFVANNPNSTPKMSCSTAICSISSLFNISRLNELLCSIVLFPLTVISCIAQGFIHLIRKNPTSYTDYLLKIDYTPNDTLKGHKVAVIGGGFCGLGLGAALKRHGIEFDIWEQAGEVGGNWNSGVYDHVHIISSKKTTEYKDFPMPDDYPDFPSQKQVLAYLNSYVKWANI